MALAKTPTREASGHLNTVFRFGMRGDVAIVEANQIKKFAA